MRHLFGSFKNYHYLCIRKRKKHIFIYIELVATVKILQMALWHI